MRSQGVAPLRSCGGFYKLYGLNLGNEKSYPAASGQGSPQKLGGSKIEQGVQSVEEAEAGFHPSSSQEAQAPVRQRLLAGAALLLSQDLANR